MDIETAIDSLMQKNYSGYGGPGPDDQEGVRLALLALSNLGKAMMSGDSDEIDSAFQLVPDKIRDDIDMMLQEVLPGWAGAGPEMDDLDRVGTELYDLANNLEQTMTENKTPVKHLKLRRLVEAVLSSKNVRGVKIATGSTFKLKGKKWKVVNGPYGASQKFFKAEDEDGNEREFNRQTLEKTLNEAVDFDDDDDDVMDELRDAYKAKRLKRLGQITVADVIKRFPGSLATWIKKEIHGFKFSVFAKEPKLIDKFLKLYRTRNYQFKMESYPTRRADKEIDKQVSIRNQRKPFSSYGWSIFAIVRDKVFTDVIYIHKKSKAEHEEEYIASLY